MKTDAGKGARAPPEDYRSALAKAKLLAVEESKQRSRPRLPESRSLSAERQGRAQTYAASVQGQKHGTTIKSPSLQDRSGAAVVKQEPNVEVLSPKDTPKSNNPDGVTKGNQYAGLVSVKKRKCEEESPEPAYTTVASTAEKSPALLDRPFAPLKKPVRGARPPYEDV